MDAKYKLLLSALHSNPSVFRVLLLMVIHSQVAEIDKEERWKKTVSYFETYFEGIKKINRISKYYEDYFQGVRDFSEMFQVVEKEKTVEDQIAEKIELLTSMFGSIEQAQGKSTGMIEEVEEFHQNVLSQFDQRAKEIQDKKMPLKKKLKDVENKFSKYFKDEYSKDKKNQN